ncbi:MAG: glycosyltransferase family 39 protein [Parcubacteria group bacterium]|jgi:4-amino-4-deoxy-L-arabinose transferase-like glycosyltransferase
MEIKNKKVATYILLTLIIALGFFLRVYNISSAPPGLYPDEAVNGTDALQANDTGEYQWFYPANNGREGLFMNIIAMCFKLFGASVLTLKLPSIIFGTLTIFGTYLLAKELFGKRVGLISSFLVAVSFWPLHFSRISFRANMLPFVLVFSFYYLFKGVRTKKMLDFAIGGLFLGLGLHTYIAFRVTPLILVVALIALIISQEKFLKNYWKHVVVFIVFTFLTAAPMLYTFFYAHPEYWASRTSEISILNPVTNQGHFLSTFAKTFGLSLAKYNFWGDQNWRHNYPPYPLLDPIAGTAFLFGFIYMIIKSFHLLYLRFAKKIRDEKFAIYITLLAWFFAMLVPEFMGAEGNPHALRSIGTLPAVFILAGFAFNYFIGLSERKNFKLVHFTAPFVIVMLIAIGMFNPIKYFFFWAKTPEAAQAFEKTMTNMQRYIQTMPPQKEIFVAVGNMQRVPVRFWNWKNPNFHDLNPEEISSINPKDADNFVVVFTDLEKDSIINNIETRFPGIKFQEFSDQFGMKFYVLTK